MNRPLRAVVGALSAWPIVYMVFFFLSIFATVGAGGPMRVPMEMLFGLHIATMAVIFGLLIFYVVHAAKNPSLTKEWRIIWIIVLLHGGFIAAPVYWYLHVWNTQEPIVEAGALSAS